ncbi:Reverse transcriptase (RNA-dependent DNA polymerase) [Stieleria neptunia]|uniref:RNA-directed DNA polymerase n=1 Tax=Stieleria neptunia TaxID=2527979 RepID=A0A518HJZ4_9BACT|nr:reverse transcriptase family protein [Stieleria neptunia]QDV41177.1 Reverse transcriptase (RNA-dependent DNA polymerase) [Stieleria neptunia]
MGLFEILKQIFAPGQRRPGPPRGAPSDPSAIDPGSLTPPRQAEPSPATSSAPLSSATPATTPAPAATSKPAGGLEGLDASRFQPLTPSEALDATAQPGWQTAYWDPLNVIPSTHLPRIRVIDQTMVGMGLIDADELAEIHDIGQRMSKFRTDYHVIADAGQQAVDQSQAARDARKQEMKKRAAERKQAHQQAVAHRKATDIVFLGRGVSKGLADRRSNIERLAASDLPLLSTPADLANTLGISIGTLRWLSFHHPASKTTHYHHWKVPKRSGGERTISRPQKKLESAQRWILESILAKRPTHDAAHGFVTQRSTLTGALPHVGSQVVVNMDLENFFPTIDFARVAGLFRAMGYSPAVATIMSLLCTESPRRVIRSGDETLHVAIGNRSVPQGACTSPALSNLICKRLDNRLVGMAESIGWRYTRYADDLSFSCPIAKDGTDQGAQASAKIGYLLSRVRHFADEEGFRVKESKTRVLKRSTRQSVTGIVVNDRPSIDRKTIRRLRAILHRAKHEGLEAQNREGHPNFAAWLAGMIAYVQMVNPAQGQKLRKQMDLL